VGFGDCTVLPLPALPRLASSAAMHDLRKGPLRLLSTTRRPAIQVDAVSSYAQGQFPVHYSRVSSDKSRIGRVGWPAPLAVRFEHEDGGGSSGIQRVESPYHGDAHKIVAVFAGQPSQAPMLAPNYHDQG